MDAALNWFFLLQGDPENLDLKMKCDEWRSSSAAHDSAFEEVASAWAVPEADEVARNLADKVASRPINVVSIRPPKLRLARWITAVAATIIIAVAIQQYPEIKVQWEADYLTDAGMRQDVELPDGSKVVLNTDTAIALDFEGDARAVRLLKGEAFFDVVHNPSRPFRVTAAFSEIEVRGTAFSVRRDHEQDAVALERGQVKVRSLVDPKSMADLAPGQAIIASATAISEAHPIDSSTTFAWLKGQIVFDDQPFKVVLHELGRYYGHSVIRTNNSFDDEKVNGRYRLDDPERAIRSLATTVGATITRLPGGILILR